MLVRGAKCRASPHRLQTCAGRPAQTGARSCTPRAVAGDEAFANSALILHRAQRAILAASVSALVACFSPQAGHCASQTRLPLSDRHEVAAAQREIIDAWNAVDDLYVDSSFLVRRKANFESSN